MELNKATVGNVMAINELKRMLSNHSETNTVEYRKLEERLNAMQAEILWVKNQLDKKHE